MDKSVTTTNRNQASTPAAQRTLRLAAVTRENLYDFVIGEGMKAVQELLERDRELLCGPKHSKGTKEDAKRWGATDGRLVMAGRRIVVRKPRARRGNKEVPLPSWSQFADEDPLKERTVEQMVLGVSTRDYDRSVESVPDELGPHGASKSAASRRFVAFTQEKLDAWLKRDLSAMRIVAIMIDGIEVGEHTIVVALGIDEHSQKHPLGLWQGATENTTLCHALIGDLVSRGLDAQQAYLFVIDGSKALNPGSPTAGIPSSPSQCCGRNRWDDRCRI
jgi:transposase-like protein